MKVFLLVSLIVFVLSAQTTEALKCYNCGDSKGCDTLSTAIQEDCKTGLVCLKMWTDYNVVRKCGPDAACNSAITKHCTTCSEDLCNAAPGNNYTTFNLACLLASIVLLQKIKNIF